MKIVKAVVADAKDLTELTIRSKSHWNYSKQQIENWRDQLIISEIYISEKEVYKLVEDQNIIIGYYSYFEVDNLIVTLDNFFIDPKFIKKGFGKIFINDFLERIKKTKSIKIILEADPNAEKFYAQFGFSVIGKLESSVKNRFLPIMELKLIKEPLSNKSHSNLLQNVQKIFSEDSELLRKLS